MATGSHRSMHFPALEETVLTGAPRQPRRPADDITDPRQRVEGSSSADFPPAFNPLLAMGNLQRDYKLVGEQFKVLHLDESAYHGNLQVILSALKRMQTHITAMIEQCEGS